MSDHSDLIRAYWEHAEKRVGEITDLWLKIEEGHASAGAAVRRLLHTMKGEAHMLGLPGCGRLIGTMEDLVERASEQRLEGAGDAFLTALDGISVMAGNCDETSADLDGLVAMINAVIESAGEAPAPPSRPPVPSRAPPAPSPAAQAPFEEKSEAPRLDPTVLSPLVHEARRLHREQSLLLPMLREIRRMLRALLAEMDPSMSTETLAERIVKTLGYGAEVERRIGDLGAQWSSSEFALENALEQLEETVRAAAMVSVGGLSAQVHRAARTAAASLDKKVRIEFSGDAYVDATVERSLGPALLHLVRNAVDHGIEAAAVRERAGKPMEGTIRVSIQQTDSSVQVLVTDDGGGVDLDALRRKLALVDPHAAASADEIALLQHIFDHGISTRDLATDISGRGVGLDVVSRQVRSVGGTIRVDSKRTQGTKFELVLPTMLRADLVVPVRIGTVRLALPTRAVVGVERITEVIDAEDGLRIRRGPRGAAELVPLFDMRTLFASQDQDPAPGDSVIVVQHRTGLYAARVDGYDNPRALSFERIEELPFQSTLIRGVAAAPDGGVFYLLDSDELFDVLRGRGGAHHSGRADVSRTWHVLVVEDAPVARELLLGLLRSFGLRVSDAADGRQGLRRANEDPPDLVLTDIEMPFLGGLEMIAEMRKHPALAHIPVVVLSTRTDPDMRERARVLGVRAFLSKQRFVEDELRRVIDECLAP